MKKLLQNFDSILSILLVIWQNFVMFGRIHRAPSLTLLWLAYTALVLLNSVAKWCNTTHFLQKWCNLTCLCAWASEGFFQGGTSGFFQTFFYGGAKSGEIWFSPHSKLGK